MTNTTALYLVIEDGKDHHEMGLHDLRPFDNWPDEPCARRAHVPTIIFYSPQSNAPEGDERSEPDIKIGYEALRAERECRYNVNCQGSDFVCGRHFKLLLDPREVTVSLMGEEAEKKKIDKTIDWAKRLGYITNDDDMLEDYVTGIFEHCKKGLEIEVPSFNAKDSNRIRIAASLPYGWAGGDAHRYTGIIEKAMRRAGFGSEEAIPDIFLGNESEAAAERAIRALPNNSIAVSSLYQMMYGY